MPPIKLQHVVSCSSEDRVHNAENMLVSDTYRKWKSAQAGEKQITVVIRLEKASLIHSIDIGNEGSAFVEILVARSSDFKQDYQVLLVSSSFLTPVESRQGTNTNRVRMFGADKLSQTVSKEKWDLIKIVCTQPFNKTIQYGLSFIVLHSPPEKVDTVSSDNAKQMLGAFKLKSSDDTESKISIGSFFAKRKSDSQDIDISSTPTAIKSADIKHSDNTRVLLPKRSKTSPDNSSSTKVDVKNGTLFSHKVLKNDEDSDKDKKAPALNKKLRTPDVKPADLVKPHGSNSRLSASSSSHSRTPSSGKSKLLVTNVETESGDKKASSQKVQSSKHKAKHSRPFDKLMEGTVFALSGYQNPQRGQIRDKALEMGAKYKPDWDNQCTHLICAFLNTPKYQQVHKKGGRIVTEKWILQCHKEKKLLPWRQFMLGKSNRPETSESDVSDTDEDIDEVHKPVTAKSSVRSSGTRNTSNSGTVSTPSLPKRTAAPRTSEGSDSDAIYAADTDVDSDSGCDTETEINKVIAKNKTRAQNDSKKPDTSSMKLPDLPNIFQGEHVFIYGDFSNDIKRTLIRYITGGGGSVEHYMGSNVSCVLTNSKWEQDFSDAIGKNSSLRILKPSWVLDCVEQGIVLPKKNYFVQKR